MVVLEDRGHILITLQTHNMHLYKGISGLGLKARNLGLDGPGLSLDGPGQFPTYIINKFPNNICYTLPFQY